MAKGLLVHALRNSLGDCTNEGLTSKFKTLVLVGPGVDGPFSPGPDMPALYLGSWKGRTIALPEPPILNAAGQVERLGPWMFGGNFVYSSDSRFPTGGPIYVYDRKEW